MRVNPCRHSHSTSTLTHSTVLSFRYYVSCTYPKLRRCGCLMFSAFDFSWEIHVLSLARITVYSVLWWHYLDSASLLQGVTKILAGSLVTWDGLTSHPGRAALLKTMIAGSSVLFDWIDSIRFLCIFRPYIWWVSLFFLCFICLWILDFKTMALLNL